MLIQMIALFCIFVLIVVGLTDENSYRNQTTQYAFIFAMFITLAIFAGLVLT